MVTRPLREFPLYGGAVIVTTPPLPLAPEAIVSQGAVVLAVHGHASLGELTPTVMVPPAAGAVALEPVSEYEHVAALCVTVKGWPATNSVWLLAESLVFALTANTAVAGPWPCRDAEALVIHS